MPIVNLVDGNICLISKESFVVPLDCGLVIEGEGVQ
jgi:hypothetical protein